MKMMQTMRYHLKRHKYKIVVGLPVAVLIASSLSLVRNPEQVCVVPSDNRFVTLGEQVELQVIANATEPINVIGASIRVPNTHLDIHSISTEQSPITLWSEPPVHDEGVIRFSGGIVHPQGFTGQGTVLTFTVLPTATGTVSVTLEDVHILAHDGTGKEVACAAHPITLYVRDPNRPTPDVNIDQKVNFFDLGLVTANILLKYEPLYDLNGDGVVDFKDTAVILSIMFEGLSSKD